MNKFLLAASGVVLVVSVASQAIAQSKVGAPPSGCITCEKLCDRCIAKGRQKGGAQQCYAGCRWWAARVQTKTVFVRPDLSVCGPDYSSARCY